MGITRKAKPTVLALEYEAIDILHQLCANRKSYGLLVSELIRQEERRRQEMRQRRGQGDAAVEEGLVVT